jgi:hypothetical protein
MPHQALATKHLRVATSHQTVVIRHLQVATRNLAVVVMSNPTSPKRTPHIKAQQLIKMTITIQVQQKHTRRCMFTTSQVTIRTPQATTLLHSPQCTTMVTGITSTMVTLATMSTLSMRRRKEI